MPIQHENTDTIFTKKGTAFLNWVMCEAGVHHLTHNPKECVRLFNVYKQVCKEEKQEKQK